MGLSATIDNPRENFGVTERSVLKHSDVGTIPSDWDAKPISALATMKSGEAITGNDIDEFSAYPCYGGNGLRGYTSSYTHDGAFALIGRQGALCGNVLGVNGRFFASEHAIVVTARPGVDIRWLSYALGDMRLNQYSESSAQPGLSVGKVQQLLIATPPSKAEQTAIAEALADAEALIGALESLVAKKCAIKQGVVQELFSRKWRLAPYSDTWRESSLREVCREIVDGTHFTPSYVDSGVPFYSVENVTANDFVNTKFISPEEHQLLIRRCKPEKGDILLTRIGAIGDTKLIDWDVDASIYVSLALLKCGDLVDPRFLYAYTKGRQFRKDIEDRSLLNASPKKINMGDIGKVPIPIPARDEQIAIADILEGMDNEIIALEEKLAKAKKIKQGMTQDLLTGRARLV